ncbi:MAG: alpha-ketoglutarate-dependent dioxygenase AlkB [Myxococcota bacterium]
MASGTIPGIVYVERFLDQPDRLFRWAVENVVWDERIRARKTASCGLPYDYRGLAYAPAPFPPELDAVREQVVREVGIAANNCLLNYYPDGRARMGWHADATTGLVGGVAIVSLGATRALRFRRTAQLDDRLDYVLAPGSMVYLPQSVHLAWQHAIPRTSRPDPRISLTFRALAV